MITPEGVRQLLSDIEKVGNDPEEAHSMEDTLFVLVLRSIADGSEDAQELAQLALKSLDFDFERWCA